VTLWPSWETLLVDMLQKPEDVVVVSAKRRGRGHGGWSKNNPYLEEVSLLHMQSVHDTKAEFINMSWLAQTSLLSYFV
jgi:hypothetical protein